MKTSWLPRLLVTAGISAAAIATPARADAYSTGVHFIVTEHALGRLGFSGEGIRIVQAASYTTDYIASIPDSVIGVIGGDALQRAKNVAHYFHYDDLVEPRAVEREFLWHRAAFDKTVADAVAARDNRKLMMALGIESHALQDFYSHSNFADFDWGSLLGWPILTFQDVPRDVWENPLTATRSDQTGDIRGLLSGFPSAGTPYGRPTIVNFPGHLGDLYCTDPVRACGVNHDMARRRHHLTSVLMATEATVDLAQHLKAMIPASTWNELVHWSNDDPGTDQAWDRAQAISAGAGQWSNDGNQTEWKIAEATLAYDCTMNPYVSQSDCPLRSWDLSWGSTLFAFFLAAPPGHASWNNAPPFPAMGVPIFAMSATSQDGLPTFAHTYEVTWGKERGLLLMTIVNGGKIIGKLLMGGKTILLGANLRDTGGVSSRAMGLDVRVAGAAGDYFAGRLYSVGPKNEEITGFLRRDGDGIPEGIHGGIVQHVPLPPGVRQAQ